MKVAVAQPKRVLIPLLFDYYLFEYFRFLIPELLESGYRVTVLTFDPRIHQRFTLHHPHLEVRDGPLLIRGLLGRSERIPFRILLWLAGWVWAARLRRDFDVAVLPWDNKVLWYIIARRLPSLTCHSSTEFSSPRDVLKAAAFSARTPRERRRHTLLTAAEKLFRATLIPRLNGEVVKYSRPGLLLADRLMGFRAPNYQQGFSGRIWLTVTGHQIKQTYVDFGCDPNRIFVVGHPGYDYLASVKGAFGPAEQAQFRQDLGIPAGRRVFTFFLSPSTFTEVQFEEIVSVVRTIRDQVGGSFFVVKFHPKTEPGEPPRFARRFEELAVDARLVTEFRGDEWNARLILISDFIVQKQSTVGFIAMIYQKPILSYNIAATNYNDDVYQTLDASIHVRTLDELKAALARVSDGDFLASLAEKQRRACERFCLATESANERIVELVTRLATAAS